VVGRFSMSMTPTAPRGASVSLPGRPRSDCFDPRGGRAAEHCGPPGSVTRADYLTPGFTAQAEALVRGIYAIAGRKMVG
jgi:hypothetical protein